MLVTHYKTQYRALHFTRIFNLELPQYSSIPHWIPQQYKLLLVGQYRLLFHLQIS
jgi:hypothetical protein